MSLSRVFSEIFDYPAYEESTANGDPEVHSGDDKLDGPTSDLPLSLSPARPLHDVQNVMSHGGSATDNSALGQGSAALRHLFHEEENVPVPGPTSSATTIRRERTQPVLDLPSSAAGPSKTPSQLRIWMELEDMTSEFGSEYGGSDAVVYGGEDEDEDQFLDDDCCQDEELTAEQPFGQDVVADCDDSESNLSDISGSSSEDESDDNSIEEHCSEEMGDCDEPTEDLPLAIPEPAPLEDVSSSPVFLRRSTRVRGPPLRYVSPPPPPSKGKSKAVVAKARSAAPPRRANLKRARSPPPVLGDPEYDADAPSGSASKRRKRAPKCSPDEVQAMVVREPGVPPEVPCAVAGCREILSIDNIRDLEAHFREHYSEENKDSANLRCKWGTECGFTHTISELRRHLRSDHLELRLQCPDCGTVFETARVDVIQTHRGTKACRKRRGAQ